MSAETTTEAQPSKPTKTDVIPYSFPSPNSKPHRTRSLTQLIDAAETVYQSLMNQELTPLERSSLVRALCDVDKRIRVWKGLPDPGILRPDSLPKKRAGRSIRQGVIDLLPNPSAAGFADDDEREAVPSPAKEKAQTPNAATKEEAKDAKT